MKVLAAPHFDGRLACELVYANLERRWRARTRTDGRRPSSEKWRWQRIPTLSEDNRSAEVSLEKLLISTADDTWANAIPTARGLFDDGGRKANVDLAHRSGATIAFVELKWASNHPAYAAFEIVGYAMAWAQARFRAEEMGYVTDGTLRPVLATNAARWCVLAPASFYAGWDAEQLARFAASLDQGMNSFFTERLNSTCANSQGLFC
ncbi:hypothetical protein ETAA1_29630 [Urbifossiella limnaea]|uniref:Uncharacterized protein n=1 Tax=Urbifossiella limnaea TaxID=2528023 RepID=A0A517XU06_9BACT|nr:hypothetical protein ETAA1_29630 [Urbifossiella limnaea]